MKSSKWIFYVLSYYKRDLHWLPTEKKVFLLFIHLRPVNCIQKYRPPVIEMANIWLNVIIVKNPDDKRRWEITKNLIWFSLSGHGIKRKRFLMLKFESSKIPISSNQQWRVFRYWKKNEYDLPINWSKQATHTHTYTDTQQEQIKISIHIYITRCSIPHWNITMLVGSFPNPFFQSTPRECVYKENAIETVLSTFTWCKM